MLWLREENYKRAARTKLLTLYPAGGEKKTSFPSRLGQRFKRCRRCPIALPVTRKSAYDHLRNVDSEKLVGDVMVYTALFLWVGIFKALCYVTVFDCSALSLCSARGL